MLCRSDHSLCFAEADSEATYLIITSGCEPKHRALLPKITVVIVKVMLFRKDWEPEVPSILRICYLDGSQVISHTTKVTH